MTIVSTPRSYFVAAYRSWSGPTRIWKRALPVLTYREVAEQVERLQRAGFPAVAVRFTPSAPVDVRSPVYESNPSTERALAADARRFEAQQRDTLNWLRGDR